MALNLMNVSKEFSSKQVLKGVSLEHNETMSLGILGRSGCGKTTLLRILAGLEEASSGSITWNGETWMNCEQKIFVPPHQRPLNLVFQNYALWPHMSVHEHVAFPLKHKAKGLSKAVIQERVLEVLHQVQLLEHAKKYPHQLSGGQAQRLALARAIAVSPKLLLLDEPLSNLDASLRKDMRKLLRDIQAKENCCLIVVSHDWSDVQDLCDRVLVLEEGVSRQYGSIDEIQKKPANDYVRGLMT